MRKILIVCNHFAPDNAIAAVRLTKIAKYLRKDGYSITVIAEKKNNLLKDKILEMDAAGIKVLRIENSERQKSRTELYKRLINPIKEPKFNDLDNRIRVNTRTGKEEFYTFETAYPVIGSLDYAAEVIRQYDLFLNAKNYLDRCGDFDYIFTSYGDYFGYFCGEYLHKKFADIPWIFDIRDSIYRYKFTPDYVSVFAKHVEKNVWEHADAIIGVSKGICRRVPQKYRRKVKYISNGYDTSDREGITASNTHNDKMVLSYTGSMYGGLQNLSVLYKCLSELIAAEKIDNANIEIRYAGNEAAFYIFRSQAEKYGLGKLCRYMGKLERRDALKLQSESDILLVASFDYNDGNGGVITGKALEYMSAGKPIISIVTGDLKNSELTRIISDCRLGCTYEEANDREDYQALKSYILKAYNEFMSFGYVKHDPDAGLLKKYDYRYISKRIEKVLNSLN
ncbi:MAG: glycosyltransferase [Oscillospiraceae bacterium]|nr:glycosyltransferase [Oscillospiraceae bacterium]